MASPKTNAGYVGRLAKLLKTVQGSDGTLHERSWAVITGTHQGKFTLARDGVVVKKVPRDAFQLDPKLAPPERVWVLIGTFNGTPGGVLLSDPSETMTEHGTFDGLASVPVEYRRVDPFPVPRPKPRKEGD